jgi:hypothetical protein
MSLPLPPKPSKASKPPPPQGPSEPPVSAADLLDGGVDINIGTYFLSGWCTPGGEILPEHTSLNAAGLARAWSRSELMPDQVIDLVLALEQVIAPHFDEQKTKWTDALPPALRTALIERMPSDGEPQPITQWFAAAAPTFKRWCDLRACTLHLGRVSDYMKLELKLRAASHAHAEPRTVSPDEREAHTLVVSDPVRGVLGGEHE